MSDLDKVWVGLAEVSIGRNCELDLRGAGSFTWCATQARDEENFSKKIKDMLAFYGLYLVDLQRVCRFNDFENPFDELEEICERVAENAEFAVYSTFYTYPHHTA